MSRNASVLLVHGAWCGEWVSWRLAPCLEARGVPLATVDLPSCRARDGSVDARDDARCVVAALDRLDGPVVVAGKSYGGAVMSGACVDRPEVAHLVSGPTTRPSSCAARRWRTSSRSSSGPASRENLHVAWDFTVMSERSLSERVLFMRDDAFAELGDAAPTFVVTSVEEVDPAEDDRLLRIVEGRYLVPRYVDSPAPGARMTFVQQEGRPDSRVEG